MLLLSYYVQLQDRTEFVAPNLQMFYRSFPVFSLSLSVLCYFPAYFLNPVVFYIPLRTSSAPGSS